jgi:twitching motility protein PilI/purine-binding chemotaxis protein CheW
MTNPSGYNVEYLDLNEIGSVPPPLETLQGTGYKQFSQEETDADEDTLLRFQPARRRGLYLGTFGIVLEPESVYEIIEHTKISPFPGVSGVFRGIVNHRGNVVPVYDLTQLTGSVPEQWERSRLLMFNSGKESVALLIFELPFEVTFKHSISLDGLDRLPALLLEHAEEAFKYKDTVWLCLQYESFFVALRDSCVLGEAGFGSV